MSRADLEDEAALETSGPVIEVRGLRTGFGDHVVHDGLDLTLERGEVLGVVGGSGTGKSVLLNTIIGLKRPQAGTVKVFGVEYTRLKLANDDDLYLTEYGMPFREQLMPENFLIASRSRITSENSSNGLLNSAPEMSSM